MRVMSAQAFMESALKADSDYFVIFLEKEPAQKLRTACYQFRGRQRRQLARLYSDEPDYIPYTEYDALYFEIRQEQGAYLLVAKKTDFYLEHTAHGELPRGWKSGDPIPGMDNPSGVDKASVDKA